MDKKIFSLSLISAATISFMVLGLVLYSVSAHGQETAEAAWSLNARGGNPNLAIDDGDFAYIASGWELQKVSKADGATLWTYFHGLGGEFFISTDSDYIYMGGGNSASVVRKISKADGSIQWSYNHGTSVFTLTTDADSVYIAGFRGGSPIANVRKLSKADGSVQWSFDNGVSARSIATDAASVYISGDRGGSPVASVRKLSKADGSLQWSYDHWTNINTLKLDSDSVYVGGINGGSPVASVRKLSKADGSLQWSYDHKSTVWSLAVDSDSVYMAGLGIVSLNVPTFRKLSKADGLLRWSYDVPGGITSTKAIALDSDSVYVGSPRGGDSFAGGVRKLSKADGSLLWFFDHGHSINAVGLDNDSSVYIGGAVGTNSMNVRKLNQSISDPTPPTPDPEEPANPDTDGDGILNEVDRNKDTGADESALASNDFNDGSTFGTIADRGGWGVTVEDAVSPGGVLVTVSGAGVSPVKIISCSNSAEVTLDFAGESALITCGSITVTAVQAFPKVEVREPATGVGGKATKVNLSTGQTVTFGSPVSAPANNPGAIDVEILDEAGEVIGSGSLEPGQVLDVEFVGENEEVVIKNLSNNVVTFSLEGATLNLAAKEKFFDRCPNSVSDEEPLENHYSWLGGEFFKTRDPKTKELVNSGYRMTQTKGCTCAQILEQTSGQEKGQVKAGCTKETMDKFIRSNNLLGLLYAVNGNLPYILAVLLVLLGGTSAYFWKRK
jgi:hypothetical protein